MTKKTIKDSYTGVLLVAIFASFIVISLTNKDLLEITPLKKLERKFIDDHFARRGELDSIANTDVIIIEISQTSYDQIPPPSNRWPWPRSIFAKLIENLNAAGARAIGLDLVMSDTDAYAPVNDSLLYETIRKYKNVVVAGKLDIVNELAYEKKLSGASNQPGHITKKINYNFENIFYSANKTIGIVQVESDEDFIYRRYRPFVVSLLHDKILPTFGFALLNKYYQLSPDYYAENEKDKFVYHKKQIPKFTPNSFLINFYGYDQRQYYNTIPLIDIIDDKDFKTVDELSFEEDINTWDDSEYGLLHSGLFKDKIVIIGSTMPEDKDLLAVSIGKGEQEGDNQIYGVYYHANAIQNVLSNDHFKRQSKIEETILIIVLTFFTLFLSILFRKRKSSFIYEILFIAVIAAFVYLIYQTSYFLFTRYNYVIPIVSLSLAVVLGYFGSTAYYLIIERVQNALIKGMFSHYVSADLVNQLLADPDKLKLGGEKKHITILFSDIVGFTPFSEGKTPEELVAFMNDYLSKMTQIVMENKGTLDKYLGDAVMAFWGAPIELEEPAYLACSAAVAMRKKIDEDFPEVNKNGKKILDVRIGINSGDVIVGNMGGENRFDYTVMGDSVNLASRLEGANKQYGSKIMISGSTYELVKDKMLARQLDTILVKGKSLPTKVFELIGHKGDEDAEKIMSSYIHYDLGIEFYGRGEFEEAIGFFELAVKVNPNDSSSKNYIERCKYFIKNPPGENWDGVYKLETK